MQSSLIGIKGHTVTLQMTEHIGFTIPGGSIARIDAKRPLIRTQSLIISFQIHQYITPLIPHFYVIAIILERPIIVIERPIELLLSVEHIAHTKESRGITTIVL